MPLSKKQLIRLIRLVARLKENRYPNCANFAAEMEKADLEENLNLACTPKTIHRDIQLLKTDFGAPIEFDTSRNGYYLTSHGWNFSCPQIFDDSCMLSAVLGARVAEHIFPAPMKQAIRDAVDFLLTHNNPAFLDKTQMDSLVVIPSNRAKVDAAIFVPVFYTWQNHEICHIRYLDSKGRESERGFEPHALIFFEGCWYTKGFWHGSSEMRTLVLPRMKLAVPTGKHFTPDPKIAKTADEEELFDPEKVNDVVVQCDPYLTNIIQTRPLHLEQVIHKKKDGSSEIHIKEISKYRLITWTMHQCGRAVVLKPVHVGKEIASFAEKIIDANENNK